MKHVQLFDAFMRDTVNLNRDRIATLESRVTTIQNFLKTSDYGTTIRRYSPQGSWAHKTIIKPPNGNSEFDADLLVFVDANENWEPKDYVADLHRVFRASGRYGDIVKLGSRCVTVDYANDFHLDVVPCIARSRWFSEDEFSVVNRQTNREEETASEAFTEWLEGRNGITGSNTLRKVIRLAKYQRDIKRTFSAKSILLTTLLGMQVRDWDSVTRWFSDDNPYSDLPTALKLLLGRLDDWLQERPEMPTVENPVLDSEDFNRHWDQAKYENFRKKIHLYRGWVDDAYAETNRSESLRKWRNIIGDEFAKGEQLKAEAGAGSGVGTKKAVVSPTTDLVESVKSKALTLGDIPFWPHVQRRRWGMASQRHSVAVSATIHEEKGGRQLSSLGNGKLVRKGVHIRFAASLRGGIPRTFEVHWQVVNSGPEAHNQGALRGEFCKGGEQGTRWERTEYRGVHWVQAFVVNRRTEECIGFSERFFVVIE